MSDEIDKAGPIRRFADAGIQNAIDRALATGRALLRAMRPSITRSCTARAG